MLAINSLRRLSHLDTLSMDYPSRERPELPPRPSSAAADRLRRRKDLLSHHGLRGPFRAARRRRYTLVVGASPLVDGFGRALQLQASVSLAALSLASIRSTLLSRAFPSDATSPVCWLKDVHHEPSIRLEERTPEAITERVGRHTAQSRSTRRFRRTGPTLETLKKVRTSERSSRGSSAW